MASVIHTYPADDLIEHDIEHGVECVCGPRAELMYGSTGKLVWHVTHHSLDGREFNE